ncbi:MAG: flagellar basal body protein, partial [Phycisphaerales bacterium JB038]
MNYGLYTSATGVLAGMYRQDVLANNLANVNTTGFKQDFVTFKQRDPARLEDGLLHLDSNQMLEQLGAGV